MKNWAGVHRAHSGQFSYGQFHQQKVVPMKTADTLSSMWIVQNNNDTVTAKQMFF